MRRGEGAQREQGGRPLLDRAGLGLSAAFGLPLLEIFWPETVSLIMMGICILAGAASLRKILAFSSYRELYQELFADWMDQMDKSGGTGMAAAARKQSEKAISAIPRAISE